MFKVYKCQSEKSNIIELQVLDNSLIAYCTRQDGLKIVDFGNCRVKKKIPNPSDSPINTCSLSPNSKFSAFSNSRFLYLADLESGTIICTLEIDCDIEIINFDLSSSYIITGTKTGKITQYKIDTEAIYKLYSFKFDDYFTYLNRIEGECFITSFALYGRKFASSCSGGAILVMDLLTQTNKHLITCDTGIGALRFLNEDTLLCAFSNGMLYIFFLNSQNCRKSIQTEILGIKEIVTMPNKNYILISGKSNATALIDIKSFKIVYNKYIKFHTEIDKIAIIKDEYIIAALQNGQILYLELPGISALKSLIIHNSFAKAYELIEKEPTLQGSNEHKKLEEMFERNYKDALKALINKNNALATQILDTYKDVKSKQAIIRDLFFAFKHYLRFEELFLEKKYALAYIICSKFEPLKQTPQYKKMEDIFKLVFLNAQKYMMQNNSSKAKELLSEYSTVASKRPLIKLLITQNSDFVELLKAIQRRDFQTVYQLTNKNETLKQIPNFVILNNQIQDCLKEIATYIKIGEIGRAESLLLSLSAIEHIAEAVEDLHKKCRYVSLLQKAYQESDFKSCYEILDRYDYLRSIELGALLEKHWQKLIQKCENFALAGDIKEIEKTVGELIDIDGRNIKIKDLLKLGFYVKIDTLIDKKELDNAETLIYVYIDTFGIDANIKHNMRNFENLSTRRLALTYIDG